MKRKMFNILKKSLVLFLVLPVILIFTACGSNSAYELAKENGFEGTEQEWLDSLKGKSAYEVAVDNGFKGTEEEWLKSLKGHDGTNGENGSNAEKLTSYELYEQAKEKGVFSGDYLDFIKTLVSAELDETATNINSSAMGVFSVYSNKEARGTAVLYKYSGNSAYFITNRHVTKNKTNVDTGSYSLYMYNGEYPITATYFGGSMDYDIAILKVEDATSLIDTIPELKFADHYLSEECYAIGNNSGLGIAVSRGIVSTDSELVSYRIGISNKVIRCFRHDAFINHGSSGGGLFNKNGELIGITNGGEGSTASLINYAIPAGVVKAVADNIIDNNTEYKTGIELNLGLETTVYSNEITTYFNKDTGLIETKEVVRISEIKNNSAAYDLNQSTSTDNVFKVNDIIVSVSIKNVTYNIDRNFSLKDALLNARIGDNISFELKRGSSTINLNVFFDSTYRINII